MKRKANGAFNLPMANGHVRLLCVDHLGLMRLGRRPVISADLLLLASPQKNPTIVAGVLLVVGPLVQHNRLARTQYPSTQVSIYPVRVVPPTYMPGRPPNS